MTSILSKDDRRDFDRSNNIIKDMMNHESDIDNHSSVIRYLKLEEHMRITLFITNLLSKSGQGFDLNNKETQILCHQAVTHLKDQASWKDLPKEDQRRLFHLTGSIKEVFNRTIAVKKEVADTVGKISNIAGSAATIVEMGAEKVALFIPPALAVAGTASSIGKTALLISAGCSIYSWTQPDKVEIDESILKNFSQEFLNELDLEQLKGNKSIPISPSGLDFILSQRNKNDTHAGASGEMCPGFHGMERDHFPEVKSSPEELKAGLYEMGKYAQEAVQAIKLEKELFEQGSPNSKPLESMLEKAELISQGLYECLQTHYNVKKQNEKIKAFTEQWTIRSKEYAFITDINRFHYTQTLQEVRTQITGQLWIGTLNDFEKQEKFFERMINEVNKLSHEVESLEKLSDARGEIDRKLHKEIVQKVAKISSIKHSQILSQISSGLGFASLAIPKFSMLASFVPWSGPLFIAANAIGVVSSILNRKKEKRLNRELRGLEKLESERNMNGAKLNAYRNTILAKEQNINNHLNFLYANKSFVDPVIYLSSIKAQETRILKSIDDKKIEINDIRQKIKKEKYLCEKIVKVSLNDDGTKHIHKYPYKQSDAEVATHKKNVELLEAELLVSQEELKTLNTSREELGKDISINKDLLEVNKVYYQTMKDLQAAMTPSGLTDLEKEQRNNWVQTHASEVAFRCEQLQPYHQMLYHAKVIASLLPLYMKSKNKYEWYEITPHTLGNSVSIAQIALSITNEVKTLLSSYSKAQKNAEKLFGKKDFVSSFKAAQKLLTKKEMVMMYFMPWLTMASNVAAYYVEKRQREIDKQIAEEKREYLNKAFEITFDKINATNDHLTYLVLETFRNLSEHLSYLRFDVEQNIQISQLNHDYVRHKLTDLTHTANSARYEDYFSRVDSKVEEVERQAVEYAAMELFKPYINNLNRTLKRGDSPQYKGSFLKAVAPMKDQFNRPNYFMSKIAQDYSSASIPKGSFDLPNYLIFKNVVVSLDELVMSIPADQYAQNKVEIIELHNELQLRYQKIVSFISLLIHDREWFKNYCIHIPECYENLGKIMQHEHEKMRFKSKGLQKNEKADLEKLKATLLKEFVAKERFFFYEALNDQRYIHPFEPETFSEWVKLNSKMAGALLRMKSHRMAILDINDQIRFSYNMEPLFSLLEQLRIQKSFTGDVVLFYQANERKYTCLSHPKTRYRQTNGHSPTFNESTKLIALEGKPISYKEVSSPVKFIYTREKIEVFINNRLVNNEVLKFHHTFNDYEKLFEADHTKGVYPKQEVESASRQKIEDYFALIKKGDGVVVIPSLDPQQVPIAIDKDYFAMIEAHLKTHPLLKNLFLIEQLGIGVIFQQCSLSPPDESKSDYTLTLHFKCLRSTHEEVPLFDMTLAKFDKDTVNSFKKFGHDKCQLNLNNFLIESIVGSDFFPIEGTFDLNNQGDIYVSGGHFVGLKNIQKKLSKGEEFVAVKYAANRFYNVDNNRLKSWIAGDENELPELIQSSFFEPVIPNMMLRGEAYSIFDLIHSQQKRLWQNIEINPQFQEKVDSYQMMYSNLVTMLSFVSLMKPVDIQRELERLNVINPHLFESPNPRSVFDYLIVQNQLEGEKVKTQEMKPLEDIENDLNDKSSSSIMERVKSNAKLTADKFTLPGAIKIGESQLIEELKELGKTLVYLQIPLDLPHNDKLGKVIDGLDKPMDSTSQGPQGTHLSQKPKMSPPKKPKKAPPQQPKKSTQQEDIEDNALNQYNNSKYTYKTLDFDNIRSASQIKQELAHMTILPYLTTDLLCRMVEEIVAMANEKPVAGLYNLHGNHWVVFCLVKRKNGQMVLLYKNSLKEESKKAFTDMFTTVPGIEFKFHTGEEQNGDGKSCGIMALENLRIMARELMKNPEEFISGFTTYTKFCNLKLAKYLREVSYPAFYLEGVQEQERIQSVNADKSYHLAESHQEEIDEIILELNGVASTSGITIGGDITKNAKRSISVKIAATDDKFEDYVYKIQGTSDVTLEEIKTILQQSMYNWCEGDDYQINDGVIRVFNLIDSPVVHEV